jgi:hypothetical protein
MRSVRVFTVAGVLVLAAVTGCDRPAERPGEPVAPSSFSHDISLIRRAITGP